MGLTDAAIRRATKKSRGYYLNDGRGLKLFVSPTGGKYWRFRYWIDKKERILAIGEYPGLGLAAAREARDNLRHLVRSGRDPAHVQKAERAKARRAAGITFEVLAREWHTLLKPTWSPQHAENVIDSLEADAFPKIGASPLAEITAPLVLECLRAIEARGANETAHRVRQRISAVFQFAIAEGTATLDPAAMVDGALAPIVRGRFPAVRTIEAARKVLRDVEGLRAHPTTKLAHRLLALTLLRPGPLVETPWREIDAHDPSDPYWTVPAARMKLRLRQKLLDENDHPIPLTTQALEVIAALRPMTGHGTYLFPNARRPRSPMSENALSYIVKRAGYEGRHVPHGWRRTFSTLMNERRPYDRWVIDMMLAHASEEKVEGVYNNSELLRLRRSIAQEWADLLMEGLPPAATLLEGKRK